MLRYLRRSSSLLVDQRKTNVLGMFAYAGIGVWGSYKLEEMFPAEELPRTRSGSVPKSQVDLVVLDEADDDVDRDIGALLGPDQRRRLREAAAAAAAAMTADADGTASRSKVDNFTDMEAADSDGGSLAIAAPAAPAALLRHAAALLVLHPDYAGAGGGVVVDEAALAADYAASHAIEAEGDRVFLEETLVGCVRHRKVIEITLQLFHDCSGPSLLRAEFAVFAVLTYLALFRLSPPGDLPFAVLVALALSAAPPGSREAAARVAAWLAFLFDAAHLVSPPPSLQQQQSATDEPPASPLLAAAWGRLLDSSHVEETIVRPLLLHAPDAARAVAGLRARATCGMVPAKSRKSPTEARPFELTIPTPRRPPEPTLIVPTVHKAS
ncbi:hypothetical protein HK405_006395, partial [Cladochytrium tenue]